LLCRGSSLKYEHQGQGQESVQFRPSARDPGCMPKYSADIHP